MCWREPLLPPEVARPVIEFLNLCPALLVRSTLEYERISGALSRRRPFEVVVLEPVLPEVERRVPDRPSVVIWAPERDVNSAALHAFALAEVHGEVTLVSADGLVPPGATCSALRVGDPRVAEVLATAGSVVLTDAGDPGAAVAFARRGYGIVAPVSSGAHEFVRDARPYDPAVQRQLHVAVMKSLARAGVAANIAAAPPPALGGPALPFEVAAPPPVTVVIPTYNRRADIERALELHCAPDVSERTGGGRQRCRHAGRRHRGTLSVCPPVEFRRERWSPPCRRWPALELVEHGFVHFLADDDWLFPDHVDRVW